MSVRCPRHRRYFTRGDKRLQLKEKKTRYGEKLSYVEARKKVYAPIYAELVSKTRGYGILQSLYESLSADGMPLVLRDYDAYDHIAVGRTLRDVINDPDRKCGHGFVLAMMLQEELGECIR